MAAANKKLFLFNGIGDLVSEEGLFNGVASR
jgi:hypothetical protein